MPERTWFRTVIIMQPFSLRTTMNAENASPKRTRDTKAIMIAKLAAGELWGFAVR